MIAGLGLVSGSFDWVAVWNNDPSVMSWLTDPYNFVTSPGNDPFAYRRVGDLAFDPAVPQPSPATHQPTWAMATNLHDVPTYLTWDVNDSIGYLPPQSVTFDGLLAGMGTPALARPVSGTTDPVSGAPSTHSLAVLDETELFAFLAPHAVQRLPATVDGAARQIRLAGVIDASMVTLDLEAAGLTGGLPVRVIATSAGAAGFTLRLAGGDAPPSYLVDSLTSQIVPGVESDPLAGALLTDVPGGATVDVTTVQLGWSSLLWLAPDPAAPGETVSFAVNAPTASQVAWTLIGTSQTPTPIAGGVVLLVSPSPPALLVPVQLDAGGDALLTATMPNNPALSGASLLLQAVIQGADGQPGDATNVFRFDIE